MEISLEDKPTLNVWTYNYRAKQHEIYPAERTGLM